jgi:hypothetical protein
MRLKFSASKMLKNKKSSASRMKLKNKKSSKKRGKPIYKNAAEFGQSK